MIDWDKETLNWTKEVPFTKENIKVFNKNGVYKLVNEKNEIVYIGSAYKKLLNQRLRNYFYHNDKVCSLRSKLLKEVYTHEKVDEYFATLKVSICEYNDLEMFLIGKYDTEYNKVGKKKLNKVKHINT